MVADSTRGSNSIEQAGAIPFRRRGPSLEFCLITAAGKPHKWLIPKGVIDPGESPPETALKEAWEEAGLRGDLIAEPVGQYQYRKVGRQLCVVVFLMEVHVCEKRWEEDKRRRRQWVTAEEAILAISHRNLRPLLAQAIELLEQAIPFPPLETSADEPTDQPAGHS
jgi:8-oxo-dGTP pyrophosphatase MutT (NUDIX family)